MEILKKSNVQNGGAVVVALGGNQPWRGMAPAEVLDAALSRFPAAGLQVVKRSRWWRSRAWPDPADPDFVNGVVLVRTTLDPITVMDRLRAIEVQFGRRRGQSNAPRTLDLDLIAHGEHVLDLPSLTLPHPRAPDRRFVMGPLAQIAPDWRHPVTGETAASMAARATIGRDAAPVEASLWRPAAMLWRWLAMALGSGRPGG